jgi:hypothetical protein
MPMVSMAGFKGLGKTSLTAKLIKHIEPMLGTSMNGAEALGITPDTVCVFSQNARTWPDHYKACLGEENKACMRKTPEEVTDWLGKFEAERREADGKDCRIRLLIGDDPRSMKWAESDKYSEMSGFMVDEQRSARTVTLLCSQRYHGKKAFPIEMRNAVDVDIWLGGWQPPSEWRAVYARLKSEAGAAPRSWQSLKRIMISTTKVIEDKKKIQSMAICLINGDTRRLRLYPEQEDDEEGKEDDAESSEADSEEEEDPRMLGDHNADSHKDSRFADNLSRAETESMLAELRADGALMARAAAPFYDTDEEFMEAEIERIIDECESARVERMYSGRGQHRGRLTQIRDLEMRLQHLDKQQASGGGAAAAPTKKRKKKKKKQEGKGKQPKGQPPPVKK